MRSRRTGRATRQGQQAELADFNEQLAARGLRLTEVGSDGKCLFRALSDQLSEAPGGDGGSGHFAVRTTVSQFLADHEHEFRDFLAPGTRPAYQRYCNLVGRDGTWGGHLELAAAAHAYGRPIEIHTLGESSPTVVTSGESSSDDAEGATPKSPVAPVRLAYHCWTHEHYNSVRRLDEHAALTSLIESAPTASSIPPTAVAANVQPPKKKPLAPSRNAANLPPKKRMGAAKRTGGSTPCNDVAAAHHAGAGAAAGSRSADTPAGSLEAAAAALGAMSEAALRREHKRVFGYETRSTRPTFIRRKLLNAVRIDIELAAGGDM
eukprot:PRCOL_00000140-RA